jgi:hypothetical protein
MKSLMIEDLSLGHALDRKAMAAVHGGIAVGGCVPPYFPLELPKLPQLPPYLPLGIPRNPLDPAYSPMSQ